MGKQGKFVPEAVRKIIFHMHLTRNLSAVEIHNILFSCQSEADSFSVKHLNSLLRMFDDPLRANETIAYVGCKRSREGSAGNVRMLDADALEYLEEMITKSRHGIRLRRLTDEFRQQYFEVSSNAPSMSTVNTAIFRDLGYTRKVITRYNVRASYVEQLEFLDRIALIDPFTLWNLDGMVQSKNDFRDRYSYSKRGEPCIREQITINDKSYPVLCAVTSIGIMAYRRFSSGHGVTASDNAAFILEEIAPYTDRGKSYALLDNASNNCTDEVHAALDAAFDGRWQHLPAYSPRYAPIERVFSLIKRFIRERESEGERDPEGLIDKAFKYYSYGGEGGSSG